MIEAHPKARLNHIYICLLLKNNYSAVTVSAKGSKVPLALPLL